jgi:hypothetical protein
MLAQVPQVEPISNLRRDHVAMMKKLKNGPIFLAQRGNLTAALISISDWGKTVALIQDLQEQLALERRLRLSNQRYAEMAADPTKRVSQAEYEQMLADAGLAE